MNILDIAIAKKLAGGGGGSGTDNYNDLSNLPKINDTTLSGNKSSSALGLQSEITSDSKLASDLVDDTNQDNKFVTSTEKQTWNAKQNAIDNSHKLSSDLVDDTNHTNKFVTSTEKQTWNAKQNAIDNSHKLSSDLVDDTNHTNKFVTSTEKQTWNAKQNAIDADHKLSSSLVSFTTAEAAALASGIDSSKVGQISTNQTNILYALNTGVRNICNNAEYHSGDGETSNITYKTLSDGTITLKTPTGEQSGSSDNIFFNVWFKDTNTVLLPTGNYKAKLFGSDIDNIRIECSYMLNGSSNTIKGNFGEVFEIVMPSGITGSWLRVCAKPNTSFNSSFKIVVCDKTVWDTYTPTEYIPYALPNSDLTYLEAEDRAALAEVVDSGAKNIANIPSTQTISSITFTKDSNEWITSTSTNDTRAWNASNRNVSYSVKAGTYIVYAEAPSTNTGDAKAYVFRNDTPEIALDVSPGQSKYIEITFTSASNIGIEYKTNQNKVRYMICTKAAFGVSSKFVPYRPNWDLVVSNLKKNTITHSKLNSSYNFHGFKITTGNRASGTAYFMGNGTTSGAGVISFSFSLSSTPILYVDKKMVMPSYVKFYYVGTDTFYIVFYTSTKWDDITILGTFTADEVEEYFSNTEIPSGATQLTETAYPTT